MMYFASKTHDRLNGQPFTPETANVPLCINPYYNVTISNDVPFMIDSGAFQDVGLENRLSFKEALNRQLEFEKRITPEGRPAYAIVSYDRLVDEQFDGTSQIRERVSYDEGIEYVIETIEAARYLSSQRARLSPRKLILSCQGTTTEQYLFCVKEVLKIATSEDIIGLGGFCIISRSKKVEQQFYEVINQAFPIIAEKGIKRVHIFGVGIIRVLVQAELLGRRYGIECSYDTSSYEVNAVMGRAYDPNKHQLTGVFTKEQKKNGYEPPMLALFNVNMVRHFWTEFRSMPTPDNFIAGWPTSKSPIGGIE